MEDISSFFSFREADGLMTYGPPNLESSTSPKVPTMPLLAPANGLVDSLKANELIPGVIPDDFRPLVHFDVLYNDSGQSVQFGNVLTEEDAAIEPDIAFLPTDDIVGPYPRDPLNYIFIPSLQDGEGGLYTLLMTDPVSWQYVLMHGSTETSNVIGIRTHHHGVTQSLGNGDIGYAILRMDRSFNYT